MNRSLGASRVFQRADVQEIHPIATDTQSQASRADRRLGSMQGNGYMAGVPQIPQTSTQTNIAQIGQVEQTVADAKPNTLAPSRNTSVVLQKCCRDKGVR